MLLGASGVRSGAARVGALLTRGEIIAFLLGYIKQDIHLALWIGLAGTALTFVAVVPPWPMYNKNAVLWLPPQNAVSGIQVDMDSSKAG